MNINYQEKSIRILRNIFNNSEISLKIPQNIVSSFSESKYEDDGDMIYKSTSFFNSITIYKSYIRVKYDVYSNIASRYQQIASSSGYSINPHFSFSEIFDKPKANYYPHIAKKLKYLFNSCSLELDIPLKLLDDMLFTSIDTDGISVTSITDIITSINLEAENIAVYHELEKYTKFPQKSVSSKYLKKVYYSLDEIFNS